MAKWRDTCKSCGDVVEWEAKDFFDAADNYPKGWTYDRLFQGPVCPKCRV